MSKEFANHIDPIDVLFSHMQHPDAGYRERLLIDWCSRYVREYSVHQITDTEGANNKEFLAKAEAELEERRMATPTMNAVHLLQTKLAQQEAAAEKLCAALEFYNQAGTKIWNEDECGERAHRAIAAYREAVKKGET